jgi:tRNA threonylcarbamoyladenosine modification (KEOPS) complex  Pcc1 subunit
LEAKICLSYKNEREAQSVAQAVSPDNMDVPVGLSVETTQNGSEVHTTIQCEKRLQTLIATIDDLLACVSVAEKTFKVAKK